MAHERQPDPEPAVRARARAVALTEALEDVRAGGRRRSPRRCRSRRSRRDWPTRRADTSIRPPFGVNFTALMSRFQMTCCRRPAAPRIAASAGIEHGCGAACSFAAAAGRTESSAASTTAPRSTERTSSRMLPVMMRETSSRSSMSCSCAFAFRRMTSRAARDERAVDTAVVEHARPAVDRVERRAQLVREHGEELVLAAVERLGLVARGLLAREQLRPLGLGCGAAR